MFFVFFAVRSVLGLTVFFIINLRNRLFLLHLQVHRSVHINRNERIKYKQYEIPDWHTDI